MSDKPITCSNCTQPIHADQDRLTVNGRGGLGRMQSFFHTDASGCSAASSSHNVVRSHKASGSGKVGRKRLNTDGRGDDYHG